jgi:hypothetical protein
MIHWSVSSFYSDIITLQYCTHFTSLLQKAHPYIINPLHTIFFGDSFGCFDCDWCCWNDLIGYQEINRMNQIFQMNPNPFIEWLRRESGIQPIRIWFIRFNQSAKARPLGLKTELNRWVNLFTPLRNTQTNVQHRQYKKIFSFFVFHIIPVCKK